jgi:hypothetical protein
VKLSSRKTQATPIAHRVLLDSYYEWLLAERERLWSRYGEPDLQDVCRRVTEIQMGREIEIPDEWIAARREGLPAPGYRLPESEAERKES